MTQKEIHNILIKADDKSKAEFIKQCGCDIDRIKETEQFIADIINISAETIGKTWGYMNEEIK